jgi:hypothetical protein
MASTKLNIAIAALVAEAQLSTVEKLFAFLGEKIEVDDDMKGYFEEFKAVLKTDQEAEAKAAKSNSKKGAKKEKEGKDGEPKAKRAPSAYNLYIRDKMAEFKAAGHSGNLMKMAIEAWNEDKGKEVVVVESSTEEPSDKETTPKKEAPKKGKGKVSKDKADKVSE